MRRRYLWICACHVLMCVLLALDASAEEPSARGAERERMVSEQIEARDVRDPRVLAAMRAVPRHAFVPARYQAEAYDDGPLPIGYGQTISQPYIVGLMTELLDLKPQSRVLEVGSGSGYQAAVLRQLAEQVYTIEIIAELRDGALAVLRGRGFEETQVVHGDGYLGLEAAAPFDAIIVTAAADHIPPPLLKQLKPGGRMVIPIGPVYGVQRLVLVEKNADSRVSTRSVLPVRFVPLTRAD